MFIILHSFYTTAVTKGGEGNKNEPKKTKNKKTFLMPWLKGNFSPMINLSSIQITPSDSHHGVFVDSVGENRT